MRKVKLTIDQMYSMTGKFGWVVLLILILFSIPFTGCGGGDGGDDGSVEPSDERILFSGIGTQGIFDPALAYDNNAGRLWMSYSEVNASILWPGQNSAINTRLAYSDDAGENWHDANLEINTAVDVTLPFAPPLDAGTWNHEVSSIVYDPGAPTNERWKMLWHHYLIVTPQTSERYLGTLIFEIEDLEAATVVRTGGVPDQVLALYGEAGSHNGAAGYVVEAASSGIIYSEALETQQPLFRMYKSHIQP